jgi:hypothetical protein
MAGLVPIGLHGSMTPPLYGPSGVMISVTPTVYVEGRPVATELADVTPHGNPYNPKAPGFNPACADAVILEGAPRVMAGPGHFGVAHVASMCSCGFHQVALLPAVKTYVGI